MNWPAKIKILVITGARADFGLLRSLLMLLKENDCFQLNIAATAGHLVSKLGSTYREIIQEGFNLNVKIKMIPKSDSYFETSKAVGVGIQKISSALEQIIPELIILVGDRYETFAAAASAFMMKIPIVHIHGGELSLGSMDDSIRHAITKLSHIHFTSTKEYARRVIQLGEEPWRVHNVGAPALDLIDNVKSIPKSRLESSLQFDLGKPTIILTYHPATMSLKPPGAAFNLIMEALKEFKGNILITGPNADPGRNEIMSAIQDYLSKSENVRHVVSLGQRKYFSLLPLVTCMVGNSSSGLIEAPSFQLPVLNIGERQKGRVRARNVVDVPCDVTEIKKGLKVVLSSRFRKSLEGLKNPYGDGHSAEKMLKYLLNLPDREKLLAKDFHNVIIN